MKPIAQFPILLLVLSGKGGVGKTLLSLLVADLLDLNSIPLDVVQIDDQHRLASSLGRDVVTVDIALLKKARKDPNTLIGAFAPLYNLIAAIPVSGRSLLVDIGATQQHLLLDYAALTELDEDLREYRMSGLAFVPVVADPESIDQAARQIQALGRVLPSLKVCLIFNERDGRFADLSPGSVAAELYRRQLEPLLTTTPHFTMPRIEGGSWAFFERQHCRLIDVVSYDVPTAMAVSGLTRPEAKLARGDVAAWMQIMEQAVAAVLPLAEESDHA